MGDEYFQLAGMQARAQREGKAWLEKEQKME